MFEDLHELPDHRTMKDDSQKWTCTHCGGTGLWSANRTNKHGNKKCNPCNGRGYFVTSPEFRKKAKNQRQARKARKESERLAEIKKQADAFRSEHKELVKWMTENTWLDFASSLLSQLSQRGSLTDNQVNAITATMNKCIERNKSREANSITVDLTKLHELFDTAKASGLKRPALTIGKVRVSLAPATGVNAGHLYVKNQDQYQGKVTPDGKFLTVRDADESIKPRLIAIAKDPKGEIRAIGINTGVCCCCGRELTDPKSIKAGIGPVCATKWDL